MGKKKRSLGRDAFGVTPDARKRSQAVKKMLEDNVRKEAAAAREVSVTVQLTPSNIKHLETLTRELEKAGKGRFTRSELIRVAITLLSVGDF